MAHFAHWLSVERLRQCVYQLRPHSLDWGMAYRCILGTFDLTHVYQFSHVHLIPIGFTVPVGIGAIGLMDSILYWWSVVTTLPVDLYAYMIEFY